MPAPAVAPAVAVAPASAPVSAPAPAQRGSPLGGRDERAPASPRARAPDAAESPRRARGPNVAPFDWGVGQSRDAGSRRPFYTAHRRTTYFSRAPHDGASSPREPATPESDAEARSRERSRRDNVRRAAQRMAAQVGVASSSPVVVRVSLDDE